MIRSPGIVLPWASQAADKRVEKINVIFDMKDINVMKFLSGDLKAFMKTGAECSQNYFPETCKRIIIVNAPGMFSMLWKVVKVFLDAEI